MGTRCIGIVVAVLAGCLEPDLTTCGFGLCSANQSCDEIHRICVAPDQLTSCASLPDGAPCAVGTKSAACLDQVCLELICGDGLLTGLEQCDRALFTNDSDDCTDLGFYEPGPISCRSDCTIDTSACSRTCGDSIKDSEEICEYNAASSSLACQQLGFYNGTTATCSLSCTWDTTDCSGFCGDGIVDSAELCEPSDGIPSYVTCLDYGYDSGGLTCGGNCTADLTTCRRFNLFPTAGAPTSINGIWQVDRTTAFLVGGGAGSAVLYRWNGSTVQPVSTPGGAVYRGVSGTSATDVFAVGTAGRISHFDGITLTDTSTGPSDSYFGVHMRTPNDGWAVGTGPGGGLLAHYDGSTWSRTLYGDSSTLLLSVRAFAADDAWAVGGSNGLLLHWDGSSWTPTTFSPIPTLVYRSVWGSGPSDVFAVGDGGVIAHYNGTSWTAMASPVTTRLTSVWGSGPDDVLATGVFGVLLHYDGTRWVALEPRTYNLAFGTGIDRTSSLVAESTGRLNRWQGAGWTSSTTLASPPSRLWGTSATNLYATAGTNVLHYDGTAWTTATSTSGGATIDAIWGASASRIFAAASDATILEYNGTSWSSIDLPTGGDGAAIRALWGSSGSDVWGGGAGDSGDLFHFDGVSWDYVQNLGEQVIDLWGSSATDVYATTIVGSVFHYDGTTWDAVALPAAVQSLWGTGATNVYGIGEAGTLVHYDGTSWSLVPLPTTFALTGISGTGANDIFIRGDGVLLHFDGTAWSHVRPRATTSGGMWVGPHDIVFTDVTQKTVVTLIRACLTCL